MLKVWSRHCEGKENCLVIRHDASKLQVHSNHQLWYTCTYNCVMQKGDLTFVRYSLSSSPSVMQDMVGITFSRSSISSIVAPDGGMER